MNRPKPSMRAIAAEHDARVKQAAERRRTFLILGSAGALLLLVAAVVVIVLVTSSKDSPPATMSAVGTDAGCASCHSVSGARSEGPTWKGLAGSEVLLQDGTTVVADETYIRRAIEDPAAQVPQGFNPMPEQQLSPDQVDQLVQYIQSLG